MRPQAHPWFAITLMYAASAANRGSSFMVDHIPLGLLLYCWYDRLKLKQ